ncbi:MAG: hypothetical protein ACM3UU_01710 [Ignavibacteriales bacterium]
MCVAVPGKVISKTEAVEIISLYEEIKDVLWTSAKTYRIHRKIRKETLKENFDNGGLRNKIENKTKM